jgi:GTP-binding protein HflX
LLKKIRNLPEQALLIHVKLSNSSYDSCSSIEEFQELAKSSDIKIVDLITYNINKQIDAKYLISKGKLTNIMSLVSLKQISVVIFNYELSASQQKNLEKFLNCKVLDRTELILYIFAKRARTFEGKLQVELARLKHLSTRLVRVWTHLERQRGGLGLRAGPGEQQIEIDRRIIKRKIKTITKNLEKIKQQRKLYRVCRQKSMSTVISLVGYTNSGKSTLFNVLTNSKVPAINMPFVTLDPTLRSMFIPRVGQVILADTVGFIRDLPHHLIDAFKATLEEINSSDLLLHVIDVSDNNSIDRKRQVLQVLKQIGAIDIPILEVYNKIDLRKSAFDELNDELNLDATNWGVQISALHKTGIENLILEISNSMCTELVNCKIKLIPKDANIRVELLNLCAIKNEVMDPITGEFKLDIMIQKQRWDKLCNKFIDLSKMVVT